MIAQTSRQKRLNWIVDVVQQAWKDIEQSLLAVMDEPDFAEFLREYRGVESSLSLTQSRQLCGDNIRSVFEAVAERAVVAALSVEESKTSDEFETILRDCEGALNLALYFWHAPGERNFQFRTVFHFTNMSETPTRKTANAEADFYLRLTEWGVQLSAENNFEPMPHRFSLALACDLIDLDWTNTHHVRTAAHVIARLRVIQREFCQLIDEWEHCNSILAVRQFGLRKISETDRETAQKIFAEIARSRDLFAFWCAGSAADLQAHISNGLRIKNLHPDVRAELAATEALLLSGFQKFLLPASVSRHVYGEQVIREFKRFTEERLRADPEDVYGLLSEAAFSTALNKEFNWNELLSLIEQKSFQWTLSADPSAALKSVAWGYSHAEHQLFTALLILVLNAKRQPNQLESYWLQSVAGLVEMPASFNRSPPVRDLTGLTEQALKDSKQKAAACLRHFEDDDNDDNQKAYIYVDEFLKSELYSSH